jgi:hypothetical protein
MPCEVNNIVKASCQMCHGATPIFGAPMSLVTIADFQRDYTSVTTTQLRGQTMKMFELARIRVNREQGTTPMPQGRTMEPAHITALTSWLTAGAPAGTACAPATPGGTVGQMPGGTGTTDPDGTMQPGMMDPAMMDPAMMGTGGTMGTAGSGVMPPPDGRTSECDLPGAFDPLVAKPGETCYEFLTHGVSSPTDTSKFNVPTGESYSQWYFNVPWPAGSLATRFGSDFDNLAVLHHWLAFSSTSPNAHGTVVPNVLGTTLGENTELVAGWAVGGCTTTYPDNVGVKLPSSGKIMVQWHHYNNTGRPAPDGSKVQICAVPAGGRPNVAGLTFLGTENFNGPAGMGPGIQNFSGSCLNDSGAPITIIGFTPHMHTIGVNMKSVIMRSGGTMETVFDKPFVFDQQVNYMLNPVVTLQPGERIVSTCTYNNKTGRNVAFGQPTSSEMCYQFALAYPHGALNNGVLSLIGSTNTCW